MLSTQTAQLLLRNGGISGLRRNGHVTHGTDGGERFSAKAEAGKVTRTSQHRSGASTSVSSAHGYGSLTNQCYRENSDL